MEISIDQIFNQYSEKEKAFSLSEFKNNDSENINNLHKLIRSLRFYIATPWKDHGEGKWGPVDSLKSYNWNLSQSHGGDLFHHSLWCGQWIQYWKNNKSYNGKKKDMKNYDCNKVIKSLKGIDYTIVLVSAYLHDIGKGGDLIFDMYSNDKYEGKGESIHPDISSEFILGKKEYKLDYNLSDNKQKKFLKNWIHKDIGKSGENKKNNSSYLSFNEIKNEKKNINPSINIYELLRNFNFSDKQIKVIALICDMHWEFGKLNIPEEHNGYGGKSKLYNKILKEKADKLQIKLTNKVKKQCIIVSCADICSARPPPNDNNDWKERCKYNPGTPPWERFGMDEKHTEYIKKVLSSSKKTNKNNKRKKRNTRKNKS